MIQYNCPNCGANLNISDDYAGKPAICGGCGNTFQCPQQGIPVLPPVIPAAPVRRRTGAKIVGAVVLVAIVLVLLIGILGFLDFSRSMTISNVAEVATSLKILAKWQIAYQAANADNGNYGSMDALCEFINYPGADPADVKNSIKEITSPPGYTFDLRILPKLKNQEPNYFCIANPVNTDNPFKIFNPIRLYVDKSQIVRYTNDGSEPNAASRPFPFPFEIRALEELMAPEREKESS